MNNVIRKGPQTQTLKAMEALELRDGDKTRLLGKGALAWLRPGP